MILMIIHKLLMWITHLGSVEMRNCIMYWLHSVSEEVHALHKSFHRTSSNAKKMTLTALLAVLAAIFQSAGGFIPAIGYLISPFATAPVIVTTIYSIRTGFFSYIMTILLLMIIQPSEIAIFPFTTGLLGLGIGIGLMYFKKRITIVAFSSSFLFVGVIMLVYLLGFPVLPSIGTSFSLTTIVSIYLFSFLYCWFWVEISRFFIKRLKYGIR
jgi:membrane-associated HD superfamily phosphohydrolase